MPIITEPGIYSMPATEYHGDCCDGPSLSSTGARTLATQCPAAYLWNRAHPPVKVEFEIGTATHLLVLEPQLYEAAIYRIPFDGYQKGEARELRDEARSCGLIPLSIPQQAQVDGMRAALFADPIAQHALSDVEFERALFARDPEFPGIWVKSRPDIMPKHRHYLADVKTTTNADPEAFARAVVDYGYHQQAAWYSWVNELVSGYRPPAFYFLVVCKSPPHLVTTVRLDDEAIGWGDILNRYARGVFAWCLATDNWPSFVPDLTQPPSAFTIGLPAWAKRELERRHEAGLFTPPQERAA